MKVFLKVFVVFALLLTVLPGTIFANSMYYPEEFFTPEELQAIAEQYNPGDVVTITYSDVDENGSPYEAKFTGTITSTGEIDLGPQLWGKKKKKPTKPVEPKIPSVPKKTNGGTIEGDFITKHAYDKHKYDSSRKSTKNRTQYGKNVDVKKLRELTLKEPDKTWTVADEGGKNKRMFFAKEFDDNISTTDTPTRDHRVVINVDQRDRSTQFPLYVKN